ncbi:uncharacterized protein [Nicotiana tomentosiformis]|uniref:uncharacterized protein isoform X1 n=1 Tax=Nicotiana tomentosiformis TaxID=4098 RepID=UPI00051ACC4D|nr:uncharacterized protein LOC104114417 isoform X1 [Nicotiana tomentosiformis]XP_018632498.1 uncharacterized protein LOC104114417 isoform X1 [Nicotiana tomentosiformis]XP_018632500.1 uncharacterized protein LOC104114417 isoform X1 [Nicotiana tomentosiformis]
MAISSGTSSSSSVDNFTTVEHTATSRLPFHPDDYTHTCHPLYVHPSDLLGSSLVTEPFDGSCYGSWRRSILVALSVRNKMEFIHGTSERPPEGSTLLRQWQICNDLVVAWLANSVTKEIHRTVVYSEFAKDIWKELETRYGKADGPRVFELKREVAHISQGALDITSYFNKLKQLRDELASLSASSDVRCTCGESIRSEEKQKVYQFLMGLDDTYVQVRSNILMIKPIPSIDTVYNILLSDEKQRQVSTGSHFSSESASFNGESSKQSYTPRVSFDNQRAAITCKYCKKTGHNIDKCYKLHGYPSNFKFSKTAGPRKAAAHSTADSSASQACVSHPNDGVVPAGFSNSSSAFPGLTKDQCSQLIQLL